MTLPLDARAVPYVASPPMDTTWSELASRYGLSVAELAAANPGYTVAPDGHTRFTRQEFVMIPVREALRAYDYFEVDGRMVGASVATLGDLARYVRRDPRRPLEALDARFLWEHPFHATYRRAVVRRMFPGEHFGSHRVRALDADPSRVELLAEPWAIPVPRRPLQPPVRVGADAPATVRLNPGWATRIEHEFFPVIRAAVERLNEHLQGCDRVIADAEALRAWCTRVDGVLGICELVRAGQRDHNALALQPLRRAFRDVLMPLAALAPATVIETLARDLGRRRDAAAELVWTELHAPRFRDAVREMMRDDPGLFPRVRAMASVALSNGYAALARVPAMRARLESLLDGIVDRIATFPRAEADGDNALVVTVCVAWERAHAAPPGAPEEDHARWLDAASEAWGTAQTWALPLTGNLPGPPSVTGAILNIYAKSLIPTLGQAPPTAGPGGRRLLDAVARAAVLSTPQRADLALLMEDLADGGRRLDPSRRTALLNQLRGSFQAGPRWTTAYGVLGAVGLFFTVRQAFSARADLDGAAAVAQVASAHLSLLSALYQYMGNRHGVPLRSAAQVLETGSSFGTYAAYIGSGVNLLRFARAMLANTDGSNPVAVISTGVAFMAGVLTFSEVGVVALLGVGASIALPTAIDYIGDRATRLPPPARYFQLAARYPGSVASNEQNALGRTVLRLRRDGGSSHIERALEVFGENVARIASDGSDLIPRLHREQTITHEGQTRTVGDTLRMLGVTENDDLEALFGG
jgi:hypothetical protein